jgi:replicative DNA helicase
MTRPLPYNLPAEIATIGAAMLVGRDALERVEDLRPDDFWQPAHADIWSAILDLDAEGTRPELIAIQNKLQALGQLGRVGGLARLMEISDSVFTAEQIGYHAQIVREKAGLRRLIMLCGQIGAEAYEAERPDALIQEVTTKAPECYAVAESGRSAQEVLKGISDKVQARLNMTPEEKAAAEALDGIPTPIGDLNEKLLYGGFIIPGITVVAAPSSQGKSAFVKDLVGCNARAQSRVAKEEQRGAVVWSIEDEAEGPMSRMVSPVSGIDARDIRRGDVAPEQMKHFHAGVSTYWNSKIHFFERIPATIEEFKAKTRRAVQKLNANLLVIDYLQLMRSGERVFNRQQEIDAVMDGIIDLANSLTGCATVLVSQLRRVHDARPSIEDLYHSAKIEQSANTIVLIYSPKDLAEAFPGYKGVILGKQKDGPTGLVVAGFDGPTVTFGNAGPMGFEYYQKIHKRKGPKQ